MAISPHPTTSEPTAPWYKQFWPWFLIGFPCLSIISGMVMLNLALNAPDTLVEDNYYKEGLAINQRLEQDERARTLGVEATLRFDDLTGEVFARIGQDQGEPSLSSPLDLRLIHPTRSEHDLTLVLQPTPTGQFRAELERFPAGRWYLELKSAADGWRLRQEIRLSGEQVLRIKPQGN